MEISGSKTLGAKGRDYLAAQMSTKGKWSKTSGSLRYLSATQNWETAPIYALALMTD